MAISELMLLIAAHFLGDFAFQSDWMVKMKDKSWEVNGYHALTYTATIYIVAFLGGLSLPMWFFGVILLSHFFIDPLKRKYKVIKNVWVDQALHIAIIFFLYSL